MEVINFIYMKKKGKNKEPRKFLFINRISMQVVISLFLLSSGKKPLKMRAGRKEHSLKASF